MWVIALDPLARELGNVRTRALIGDFRATLGDSSYVVVGQAVGREDPEGARRSVGAGIAAVTAIMSVTAALFLTVPAPLARLAGALHEHGCKADRMESRQAFAEKRAPVYRGWDDPQELTLARALSP